MKYCLFVFGVLAGAVLIGSSVHDYGQNEATYIVYLGVVIIAGSLAGLLAAIAADIREEIRRPRSDASRRVD